MGRLDIGQKTATTTSDNTVVPYDKAESASNATQGKQLFDQDQFFFSRKGLGP